MKATRVAWKVREQMEKFLGIFYPQFSKPQRRFIGERLFGIPAAQEVKLRAISRRLGEATSLKKTEERLSRHLGVKGLGQRINERLAREGAQRVGRDTLLVVDLTDIRKGYARRMPYLDRVRASWCAGIGARWPWPARWKDEPWCRCISGSGLHRRRTLSVRMPNCLI